MPIFFLAGSGTDMFSRTEVVDKVIGMVNNKIRTKPENSTPQIAYIGTASYDSDSSFQKQAARFELRGFEMSRINLVLTKDNQIYTKNEIFDTGLLKSYQRKIMLALPRVGTTFGTTLDQRSLVVFKNLVVFNILNTTF